MRTSDALWELFKATGRIGAYLLYKECTVGEGEIDSTVLGTCCASCFERAEAE